MNMIYFQYSAKFPVIGIKNLVLYFIREGYGGGVTPGSFSLQINGDLNSFGVAGV